MRQIITMTIIVATTFLGGKGTGIANRENIRNQSKQVESFVVQAEKRPDLRSDFSEVAQLKLNSRKTAYRMGEMISLDIALLNISSKPIFFRRLRSMDLYALLNDSSKVSITPYIIVDSLISPKSFQLLQPGEMTDETVQVLVGCDKKAFKNISRSLDENSDRRIFEQNLFVSWGDKCLNVRRSGRYTLIGKDQNNYVVVSSGDQNIQTAVGNIESKPLTITITK